MAESIAQQVRKLLDKNPDMTNKALYAKLPQTRPNTIRHYKSAYLKMKLQEVEKSTVTSPGTIRLRDKINQSAIKMKIASTAQKAAEKFQKPDLEKRVATLEKKVEQMSKSQHQPVTMSPSKRSTFSMKSENLDKRIRELKRNLLGFIAEKRNKIKSNLSNLDELQQTMSNKISQFLASLKSKG